VRGIIGGILLFLGRELNFIFAGAMAGLLAYRLTPLLPPTWPAWSDAAFMITLGLIAAILVLVNERFGYFLSGFLAGGFFLVEYYAPNLLTVPWLPFLVGGVIGSLVLGLLTEWALILVSAAIGASYLLNLFVMDPTAEILVGAGLFIIGALTQVIIMQSQKQSER
ncbi:MAG TPA: hypothetical protein VHO49_17830, partial [Anaerolineales bacterium]|nr:hypothetical protein [Anaerolineales bacterium]